MDISCSFIWVGKVNSCWDFFLRSETEVGEEYNYLAGGVLDVITLTGTVFISDFKWHYNPEMREDAMQTYASIISGCWKISTNLMKTLHNGYMPMYGTKDFIMLDPDMFLKIGSKRNLFIYAI